MRLMEPFENKGRNAKAYNFYTSVAVAERLLSKRTAVVGTIHKVWRDDPPYVKKFKLNLHDHEVPSGCLPSKETQKIFIVEYLAILNFKCGFLLQKLEGSQMTTTRLLKNINFLNALRVLKTLLHIQTI